MPEVVAAAIVTHLYALFSSLGVAAYTAVADFFFSPKVEGKKPNHWEKF